MLLNEREEQNIIKSLAKNLEQPNYSKDKLRIEILDVLKRDISTLNEMILEGMLQQISKIPATNQNDMLRVIS